jgi:hypothetical protein
VQEGPQTFSVFELDKIRIVYPGEIINNETLKTNPSAISVKICILGPKL